MNKYRMLTAASILAATILLLVACTPHPSIAEINRDPGRYSNQDVRIAGHVSSSFGAFGTGVYEIDDGTGKMWVYSENGGLPGSGAQLSVTGRIQQGFSIGGRSYATILKETEPRH